MTKLLIFFGFFFGILYFFYYKFKKFLLNVTGQFEEDKNAGGSTSNELRVDKGKMVKCPVCGVYFPESTGVKKMLATNTLYCSNECAKKAKTK